jgi:hypothetical protein
MKISAYASLLLLCSTAYGQALECPKVYPSKGKEDAPQARLISAGVTAGDVDDGGDLQGDIREFKGGRTVEFALPSGQKHFVCVYGKHYEHKWSTKLDENFSQCKLIIKGKVRKNVTAKLTCR